MNLSKILFGSILGSLLCFSLSGAPSTELVGDFFLPLESESNQFVLADINSGRLRVSQVELNGTVTEQRQFATYFPGITGITSGFLDGGVEQVFVANVDGNQIGMVPVTGGGIQNIKTLTPGPSIPALTRTSPGSPFNLACVTHYAASGHGLELLTKLANSPSTSDIWLDRPTLHELQPLYATVNGERFAVSVSEDEVGDWEMRIWEDSGFGLTEKVSEEVPVGTRVATSVIGEDGRLMVVSYVPSSPNLILFSIGANGVVTLANSVVAPFAVGAVSAVSIAGQTHGLTLTASDGSQAALAEVLDGKTLNILETFAVTPGQQMTGLVPVAEGSLIRLEKMPGFVGGATSYGTLRKSGGSWSQVQAGSLGELPGFGDTTKATLFWYQGNPVTDDNAELLTLESRDEWTRTGDENATIPNKIFGEQFIDSATGLGATVAFVPSPPTGASFLVTNQFTQAASIMALDNGESFARPDLEVTPASGFYEESRMIKVTYNEVDEVVYFRSLRSGREWQVYDRGIPVSYNATYLFYSENQVTGRRSGLVRRDYSFGLPDFSQDWDSDGVPDAVEQYYFLNPAGGADSDQDGASDLEEILADTDPRDPSSVPASVEGVTLGDGFELLVQPRSRGTGIASVGVPVHLWGADGSLLEREDTVVLQSPEVQQGKVAVRFQQEMAVSEREWVMTSTPVRYRLGTNPGGPFNGVECYRLFEVPVDEALEIEVMPSGADLVADAEAWIQAARDAYADYEPATELFESRPWHNGLAVIGEGLLHAALLALEDDLALEEWAAMAVPASMRDFSIMMNRAADAERTPFSREMLNALLDSGFDGRLMVAGLNAGETAAIRSFASALEYRFLINIEDNPAIPYPIDIWRLVMHEETNSLPFPYQSLNSSVASMRAEMNALAESVNPFRPTESWPVVVEQSSGSLNPDIAFRRTDSQAVRFVDARGAEFRFEQGLGIPIGSTILVRGYVDLPPAGPFGEPVMEVLEILSLMVPEASGSDTDGSLLEDDWEEYFFGELGQSAFSIVPGSEATLLQFFLEGLDPREGASFAGEVLKFGIDQLEISLQGDGSRDLIFDWPAEYLNNFNFELLVSPDLSVGSFVAEPNLVLPVVNVDGRVHVELDPVLLNPEKNFFLLRVSLSD